MHVCSIAQLCLTLCDPMDCSQPGSSIHGILQAKILKWVAMSFSNAGEYENPRLGNVLVVQWLRICLPMQRAWV